MTGQNMPCEKKKNIKSGRNVICVDRGKKVKDDKDDSACKFEKAVLKNEKKGLCMGLWLDR
jgi:hypothetical protein